MNETLKLTLGYILSLVYMGAIMLLGERLHQKWNIKKEVARKLEHIATGGNWFIAYFFVGPTYHLVILSAVAAAALALITFGGFLHSVERDDEKRSYGLVYFGIANFIVVTISVFLHPPLYPLTGIAFLVMTFGDGLAPLIARIWKKNNPKIHEEKTLVGTCTVLVVSTLIAIIFNAWFGFGYSWQFLLSIGCFAAVVELYSPHTADNFTLLCGVYAYLVLAFFNFANDAFVLSVLLSLPLVLLSALQKSLTPSARAISVFYLSASSFFLGYAAFVTIVTLFLVEAVISKITTKKFNQKRGKEIAKTPRGPLQILVNSLPAFLFAALSFALQTPVFAYASFAALCEEFADSVASDVGRLAKKRPIDILRLRPMQAGLSGGVSLLGTLSSVLAAAFAAYLPLLFYGFSLNTYMILFAVGFLGVILDSVLGSSLQRLYQCPVCEEKTERTTHCGVPTQRIKGLAFVDNNLVNLLSGAFSAFLAAIAFALL